MILLFCLWPFYNHYEKISFFFAILLWYIALIWSKCGVFGVFDEMAERNLVFLEFDRFQCNSKRGVRYGFKDVFVHNKETS